MQVGKSNIYELFNGTKQYVIPSYQRPYSWREKECERLWKDIVKMERKKRPNHFVGSIVNIAETAMPTGVQTFMVIDGQQRMTTLSLLLMALRDFLTANPDDKSVNIRQLNAEGLVNEYHDDEERYKIVPIQSDRATYKAIVDGKDKEDLPQASRLLVNYRFFMERIAAGELTPLEINNAMKKLLIVNITLDRDHDDPQLIFESLNSTGVDLTQSDLIRNFVLMGLPVRLQAKIYKDYWSPMEVLFRYDAREDMDHFFRDYLTLVQSDIPKESQIYETFKSMVTDGQLQTEELCKELFRYAKLYTRMIYAKSGNADLDCIFKEISNLRMEVAYPFLLRVYADFEDNVIQQSAFEEILRMAESYVFRRRVCEIPANSHNKTFSRLYASVKQDDYLNSVKAFFLLCEDYKEFPDDATFKKAFVERNIYKLSSRGCHYVLSRLQNYGTKSPVDISNLTIEHIMPENKKLSLEWKQMLGPNWEDVHTRLLHTIGNLTLTAYNSEMSDRPFSEKMEMEGGFKQSALKLNSFVVQCSQWTEKEINARAEEIATLAAAKVWPRPTLTEEQIAPYRPPKKEDGQYKLESYEWNQYTRMLFDKLNSSILNLSTDIKRECKKLYIAYKYDTNFVDITVQKERLRLAINAKFDQINDPKGICRNITGKGRWGNGDVEVFFSSLAELDDVMAIIAQALDLQMN
mgnify:CR=1 FL=1